MTAPSIAERLIELHGKATPGPFKHQHGGDEPIVSGSGLVGRSCIARHCDDPEGHADAELHALLRNCTLELAAVVSTGDTYFDALDDLREDAADSLESIKCENAEKAFRKALAALRAKDAALAQPTRRDDE